MATKMASLMCCRPFGHYPLSRHGLRLSGPHLDGLCCRTAWRQKRQTAYQRFPSLFRLADSILPTKMRSACPSTLRFRVDGIVLVGNSEVAGPFAQLMRNRLVLSRLSVLRLSEFSVPLLPECLDEFTFRLNEGSVKIHTLDRIDSLLEKSVGTRITYKQLVVPKGSKIHCSLFYADDRGSVSAHAEFSGFPPGILFCAPSTELRTGAHDGAESALRGSITRDDLSRRHAFKSTRPPEPGSPATDLRRWGGARGDPVRD